jgi:hypothetical protein
MHSEAWLTRLFEAILSLEKSPPVVPSFPKQASLAFRHVIFCIAREGVFTGLSSISTRRSSMYATADLECFP